MVNVCPWQIEPLFAVIGDAVITDTLATAGEAATHPAALVPVTKYMLFTVGVTTGEPEEYV